MSDEAKKFDSEKVRLDLLPPDALEPIARVLDFGGRKYGYYNWAKGMGWSRCYGAALRHLFAWWSGEKADPETGISHLAHAACCLLFLLAYERRGVGADNRPTAAFATSTLSDALMTRTT